MKIAIDWTPSTIHGWGLYALNIALAFADDPDVELWMPQGDCMLDPLRGLVLSQNVASWKREEADVFLHSLGNDFANPDTPIERTIGVVFFEEPLSVDAIERAKRYPLIIAGSNWNADILRKHGVKVAMIHQGVDRTLFHSAPKLFRGRFPVFSGGKAEWRKGQDLVLKAFKVFAEKHDDAVLVTAWHSPWPQLATHIGAPLTLDGRLDVYGWARQEGIKNQILDIGMVHNPMMPQIYREMACAVFPNRAEGGTNLVAMECIASGVPTIVSHNTGHMDLNNCLPLVQERLDEIGRGETSIDAVVQRLEDCYDGLFEKPTLQGFSWSDAAKKLKEALCVIMPA